MDNVNELANRFVRCAADVQEWAEKAGYENLKQRIESGNAISAQAATTLTLLLAGLGGSLAFAVPVLRAGADRVSWGAALMCLYLVLLAGLLVLKCITLEAAPALYNQPGYLLIPDASLPQLRAGELANLELRIRQQTAINDRRAGALNRIRYAAILSPAVFLVGAAARG